VSTAISLYNLLLTGTGEWYVYLGQIINAGVAFILFVWINNKKLTSELTLLVAIGHVLLMYIVLAMFPLPLVQLLATIAIIIAYVDQIKHFIKTKNAEGTNPLLYFFFALGLALLLVIMILTNASFHIMITE
uniref:PQ-loop domain-containing transporter n=1 Tax=Staphylococcus capitis TaxID=29388 RepID=UPI00066D0A21